MSAARRGFVLALLFFACAPAQAQEPAAAYLLLVDGKPAASRAADRALPFASLTKMMTALLVLEADRLREPVVIPPAAARETGAKLGLKAGEKLRAADLLAAMVLRSANDACHALAVHHAGSVAAFVAQMNARAGRMGLRATHFGNPCGHDAPGHVSSARDLAVLAQAVMAHKVFAGLASSVRLDISSAEGRFFALENSNQLIGRYPGALGVKTGYTAKAGRCLAAYAERDGRTVVLVLLNARGDRWWGAVGLLDRAFKP